MLASPHFKKERRMFDMEEREEIQFVVRKEVLIRGFIYM